MVHTVDDLAAEVPTDLRLDSDRQVQLGPDRDLDQIDGLAAVGQSLVINSGNVLRSLVGGPLTGQQLSRAEDQLTRALRNDVQIDNVERVSVETVNRSTNVVTIKVFVGLNNEFTLPVEV